MSNYQAVYDAVRSAFCSDFSSAFSNAVREGLDFSWQKAILSQEISAVANTMRAPSAIYRPKLSIDGDKWCALYGENLQDGVAGFGDSPCEACEDFDRMWFVKLEVKP